MNYWPLLDTSKECNHNQTSYFQNLIGSLIWIIQLGHENIAYEVSDLSSFQANPRTGHRAQALHIFKYLEIHSSNTLAFDPMNQSVDSNQNVEAKVSAMRHLCIDANEEIPPNGPEEAEQICARHGQTISISRLPSYEVDICNTLSVDSTFPVRTPPANSIPVKIQPSCSSTLKNPPAPLKTSPFESSSPSPKCLTLFLKEGAV